MSPTKELNKYFLSKVGDCVVLNLTTTTANALAVQIVEGEGVVEVEVSMDLGHSWAPISLQCMLSGERVRVVRRGSPAWAAVPGITHARAVLLESTGDSSCKVNFRYGRT